MKSNIVATWVAWHFYQAPNQLLDVWKNYIAFGAYYFSVYKLALTLFSPWRKYVWVYPKAFDAKEYFGVFISNMYSRVMGFFMRIFLIAAGIVFQLCILAAGMVVLLFWLALPIIMVLLAILILYA